MDTHQHDGASPCEEIRSLTVEEMEAVSGGMAFGVMGLAAAAAGAGNGPPPCDPSRPKQICGTIPDDSGHAPGWPGAGWPLL